MHSSRLLNRASLVSILLHLIRLCSKPGKTNAELPVQVGLQPILRFLRGLSYVHFAAGKG